MRRNLFLFVGIAAAALAFAKVSNSTLLTDFGKAINDAKSVQTEYTFQTIGKSSDPYSVILQKPNMFRIETPSQLVVGDGKQVTTYDKEEKTYYKQPQGDVDVKSLFRPEELHVWAGFFDPKAYDAVKSKDLGDRTVKGGTLSEVEASYDARERKVITYMLNPQDKVARQAQIELDKLDPNNKVTMVLSTKSLALNGDVPKDSFTFNPPADSREMTLEEMNSAKWYYDLDQAKAAAAKSGKKIFIDFYATWCGPCKRLEADCFGTEQFKKFGSKLVFCRIDVDDQASVASAFGITAMPTQDITDKDGAVLAQTIGYANADEFFKFLSGAVGAP